MTDRNRGNPILAATIILAVFGAGFYFMPSIMLFLGEYSALAGIGFAVIFVAAFFAVFYLRANRNG
jgi:hypothetical protein